MKISNTSQYGALQAGFEFDLPEEGLVVLTGRNNAGKSSILQLAFRSLMQNEGINPNEIALIMPERSLIELSTETGGNNLESFNNQLIGIIAVQTLNSSANNYNGLQLPKVLISNEDFAGNLERLRIFSKDLKFPEPILKRSQHITFEDVMISYQGSGLRNAFAILCALSDPTLKYILIDEPENSLEPKLQKSLHDLLINESEKRTILISTHSHLFLHRKDHTKNIKIHKQGNNVHAEQLKSIEELYDLTFDLLGNDTRDLFFPGNFLVVEGTSDQIICEKALELLGVKSGEVKVVAAGGISRAENKLAAIEDTLTPIVMRDSPYSKKVTVLIDKPKNEPEKKQAAEFKRILKSRFFKLNKHSMEEYLPEELYTQIGKTKSEVLYELANLKGKANYPKSKAIKEEISNKIAQIMTKEHLENMPEVLKAVKKAANIK